MLPQLCEDVNVDLDDQQSIVNFFLNKLNSLQITKGEILVAASRDRLLESLILRRRRCEVVVNRQCLAMRYGSVIQTVRLCRGSLQDWSTWADLSLAVCAQCQQRRFLISYLSGKSVDHRR